MLLFKMSPFSLIEVTASFNEIMYSFSEGVGQSSGIAVNLTNQIAQELQISIYAGMCLKFHFNSASSHNFFI